MKQLYYGHVVPVSKPTPPDPDYGYPENPVDPDYGIDEGDTPPPRPSPRPPTKPVPPTPPGIALPPGWRPPSHLPAPPERPPIDLPSPPTLPPGIVWPPFNPGDGVSGKIIVLVWVVGVGYKWAVLDTGIPPVDWTKPVPPTPPK